VSGAVAGANASQSVVPPRPPVSVTITVPPGATVVELTDRIGAATIENARGVEVPPPGVGENTVTWAEPIDTTSAAGIAAVSWPALTYVVGRSAPFQRTTDDEAKLLPFTVSVNADCPTTPAPGESDDTCGTGFDAGVTVIAGLVAARV
jgi:hypothetical protein